MALELPIFCTGRSHLAALKVRVFGVGVIPQPRFPNVSAGVAGYI